MSVGWTATPGQRGIGDCIRKASPMEMRVSMDWRTKLVRQNGPELSRKRLLKAIDGAKDLTFIRSYGNIGDELIYAGTRQLLTGVTYREANILNLAPVSGHTALLSGGGAWCRPFNEVLPSILPLIEARFERVILMPSSFDTSVESVRETLTGTRALVFARERVSFEQVRSLCDADLAYDCAFFFDFRPYRCRGSGHLKAYRTDRESCLTDIPDDHNDLSATCGSLDEWLWTISSYDTIETDRAHVTIAGALLGKQVQFRPSSYHKVPAIVEYSLRGFPVSPWRGKGAEE